MIDTLFREKERIAREKWNNSGVHCKACNNFVKVYKRHVTDEMALFLAWIVKEMITTGIKYHHYKNDPDQKGSDYAKLELWGLIKRKKGSPGYWRSTRKGYNFLRGRIEIPRDIFLDNGKKFGYSVDNVSIKDCFKNPFSYTKLMETQNKKILKIS